MDRRRFLTALGCSAAAHPLMTPVAMAQGPWENRLIVIILRGGMDGIDAFRPVGDPNFARLRPDLNSEGAANLNGFWAMHPSLAPLLPLWQAGEMGFVPAVSTPYRGKRSHFDGQDLLEAGGPLPIGAERDGWLNRMMQTVPGLSADIAYSVGDTPARTLDGKAPFSQWSPGVHVGLNPHSSRLLGMIYESDPIFHAAAQDAIEMASVARADLETSEEIDEAMQSEDMMGMMGGTAPKGNHVEVAKFAAARLLGPTRIASFSLSGWDTHGNQGFAIKRPLKSLAETILTLRAGLGPVWEKTGVLCMTEFGRTARQNGTEGTDHGTGGAMLYAGGALRGGQVAGKFLGLSEANLYDRRDVMPVGDIRAQAAWVMHGLFGLSRSDLERNVFPGLDLGDNPGLVL